MQIVSNTGSFRHMTSAAVDSQVMNWEEYGELISDAAAQTIASWWHSPGNESATLSTLGIVTATMTISDFATTAERDGLEDEEEAALSALEAYITAKQIDAGMRICDSCGELAFLIIGHDENVCRDCE